MAKIHQLNDNICMAPIARIDFFSLNTLYIYDFFLLLYRDKATECKTVVYKQFIEDEKNIKNFFLIIIFL